MPGVIYLVLASLLGYQAAVRLIPGNNVEDTASVFWVRVSAGFGIGILSLTWPVYILAYILHVTAGSQNPLRTADLVVMCTAALILLFCAVTGKQKGKAVRPGSIPRTFFKELAFYAVIFAFVSLTMTFVFFEKDKVLYSGFTVFGDYAPHTAMMRSFSLENNYPTQYPHFGGEDVKYHFMFQFLTGNLEYLGMRLDIAYNLVSSLSLTCFLIVLTRIAYRITGSFVSGILCCVLFFFRSGTAFFRFAAEHLTAGDLIETLKTNTQFIGYTPKENWGLWNYNVYLNQRHFAFGLLIAAVVIWIFLDRLGEGAAHEEKGLLWLRGRLFSADAWQSVSPVRSLIAGILLGSCAFFNGATVIGALLILCGMAVFSDGKLDYLILALSAVSVSMLQTGFFITGESFKPAFFWGFICEDKSLTGVLGYIVSISGFSILGLALAAVFMKRAEKTFLFGCLFPVCFAFLASLTPDITVNHKYIMMSQAFLTVFWAGTICRLAGKRGKKSFIPRTLTAVLMTVCLTLTGIYDFVVILKDNDKDHRVAVRMDSTLTAWLSEHLSSEDLVLTPEYSINEVTMSGLMMYLGWPYYAWSAGYDTYSRADLAKAIYSCSDQGVLRDLVARSGVTHILYEQDMKLEETECREDVIAMTYPLIYTSDDGRIRVYEAR